MRHFLITALTVVVTALGVVPALASTAPISGGSVAGTWHAVLKVTETGGRDTATYHLVVKGATVTGSATQDGYTHPVINGTYTNGQLSFQYRTGVGVDSYNTMTGTLTAPNKLAGAFTIWVSTRILHGAWTATRHKAPEVTPTL